MMIVRRLLVAVIALILAVQVIRNAAVAGLAPLRPDKASRLWSDHPDVRLSSGAIEIAASSRARRPVERSVLEQIYAVGARAPLDPEPFLVRGVDANIAGDPQTAERAFAAAQWRDPRSVPAAYFLADRYVRAGKAAKAIEEIFALSRLAPDGSATMAPYLAAYARDRANWPALNRLFATDRKLQGLTLAELARDPANTDIVLGLARGMPSTSNGPWLGALIRSLIETGQYGRARLIWASMSKVRISPGMTLYDSDFTDKAAPPPFNWSLQSSALGLAERQPGGRLHILYYGQQEGVLASELLLLPPGPYRLNVNLLGGGQRPEALGWSIRCDKKGDAFGSVALDAAVARGWTFNVPADCPAQWLELTGHVADVAQQSDVTIAGLRLAREAPGA